MTIRYAKSKLTINVNHSRKEFTRTPERKKENGLLVNVSGSLTIEPTISESDKECYKAFVEENSYPANPKANYSNPWVINDEGRLECRGCKFFEHDRWMEFIYDKFFDIRGYDVYGSLLYSSEGRQTEWSVLKYDNGKVAHPHMEAIHIDLDFWEEGAEYARERRREQIVESLPKQIKSHDPESYGGLFEV